MPNNPNARDNRTSRKRNRQRGKVRATLLPANRAQLGNGLTVKIDEWGARQSELQQLPSGNTQTAIAYFADREHETAEQSARALIGSSNRELPQGYFTILVDRSTSDVRRAWKRWQANNPLARCAQLTWHIANEVLGTIESYGMETIDTSCEWWTVDYSDTYSLSLLVCNPWVLENHLSRGERVSQGSGAGEKPVKGSGKPAKPLPGKVSESMHLNHSQARKDADNKPVDAHLGQWAETELPS